MELKTSELRQTTSPDPATRRLDQIARTLLYEGYILWPYRRSAIKNQRRWTIGGVYPVGFEGAESSGDSRELQAECLLECGDAPHLEIRVRFLHRVFRQVTAWTRGELVEVDELTVAGERFLTWDEAVEREIVLQVDGAASIPLEITGGRDEEWILAPTGGRAGALVRSWEALQGVVEFGAERLGERLYRVHVRLENTTPAAGLGREAALGRTMIAAHLVLRTGEGGFISLLEPPESLAAAAASCRNLGCWPVLVGEPGDRRTILAPPIILYDYPEVAPESPGDLFDGTEIDQLLILNIMGLTDAEKEEMRASDPRAREILDRAEALGPEEMLRLFGAVREYRDLVPYSGLDTDIGQHRRSGPGPDL